MVSTSLKLRVVEAKCNKQLVVLLDLDMSLIGATAHAKPPTGCVQRRNVDQCGGMMRPSKGQ
jgi:hypothetical protein